MLHHLRDRFATAAVRQPSSLGVPRRAFSRGVPRLSTDSDSYLFEYTSGRWLWNEALRLAERKRPFHVAGLKALAAAAVERQPEDVTSIRKLAEGGFNRTFLLSMRDGFELVARIPYPVTEPKHLLIANEVATLDYMRASKLSVPQVYGYSTTPDNPARTEYILMEFIQGTNLGDIWFNLGERERIFVVRRLVDFESRLFALNFAASGSLFYEHDLDWDADRVRLDSPSPTSTRNFCVGRDMDLAMWFGKRKDLHGFRGPYRTATEVMMAGAQKEARYLELYGRPLHPFERLRREKVGYEKQQPQRHLESLRNYLQVASSLAPSQQSWSRPTTRHHDFQPNNVFVSDDLQITGVIDWQNTVILPLFLQGGIPGTLQNHGDGVSERLEIPRLPDDFDELAEDDQLRQVLLLRKRQLHHTYVMATKEANPLHGEVLTDPDCILRRKLFRHAGDPWEGDSVTLKADLLELARRWPQTVRAVDDQSAPPCPIDFIDAEATETTRLLEAFVEADEQMQTCLELVGAGPEGRVPCELYDEVKRRAEQLKSDTLQEAESAEEKSEIEEHWIFADFDESEYL